MPRLLAISALLMLTMWAAAPAARPGEGPTAGDKETARSLMSRGQGKKLEGDYRGALEDFEGADRIMGVPSTTVEVGRMQMKLGMLVEARDTLLRCTRYPAKAGEPKPFTTAREECREMAAAIAPRIPTLRIEVSGVPEGTPIEVAVDGNVLPAGTHNLPRKVNPGKKVVWATATGFQKATQSMPLTEGEEGVVALTLEKLPDVPKPKPKPKPKPDEPPPPVEDDLSPLVPIGFAVGGAGLIVGTITGILSLTATSDVKEQCTDDICPQTSEEDINEAMTLANVSNIGLGVGAAGVIVGVIGFFIDGSDEAEPSEAEPAPTTSSVHVEPLIGVGMVGLTGRF